MSLTEVESDNLGNTSAVRRFLRFKDPEVCLTSLPPSSEPFNHLPPRVFKIGHSHRSLVAHHSVRTLSSDMSRGDHRPLIPTAFVSKQCFWSWSFPFQIGQALTQATTMENLGAAVGEKTANIVESVEGRRRRRETLFHE